MENEAPGAGEGTESSERLTQDEINLTLKYLLSHKMAFTQEFLRERGLPFSGTKKRLRERLEEYLADGRLDPEALVHLLNQIEGWGDQHLYLYKAAGRLMAPWSTEDSVRKHLSGLGRGRLLGRPRPVVLPAETNLSSIEWTPERVRFVWIEKRQWEERVPDEDMREGEMVWRAYRLNVSRGIISFDWDLVSGHAMLMIQRLPRGSNYTRVRARFEKELEPLVALSQFERLRVSRVIVPIQESGEVRRRQLRYQTRRGGRATFTSAGPSRDALADPALDRAEQALGEETAGLLGNFYWIAAEGKLGAEIHAKIYASDQRIGLFGEHEERDVRHVVSRIRHYCG